MHNLKLVGMGICAEPAPSARPHTSLGPRPRKAKSKNQGLKARSNLCTSSLFKWNVAGLQPLEFSINFAYGSAIGWYEIAPLALGTARSF